MSTFDNPDHPLWDCIKYTTFLIALTTILWVNASDFDVTEIRSILTMLAVMGGYTGVERFIKKSHPQEKPDKD